MPKVERSASLREVAALADVSIQTVSNVLNAPHIVKSKTREKVLWAINDLEYIPNLSARRLRSKKSSSIAVRLDPNFSEGQDSKGLAPGFIQDEFVYCLVEAANTRGIKVIAYTVANGDSELSKLKTFINSRDVDGIILTATREKDERLEFLEASNSPFLSFGRPWGAAGMFSTSNPWIDIDGRSGTAAATQMFWDSNKRTIGFIGWENQQPKDGVARSTGEDRYLGWFEKLRELSGKSRSDISLATFGGESIESGRRAARELLHAAPELDAVVCVSDTLALGCLLEFQKKGLNHILVSGFDNSPVSKEFGFSSLDQNLSEVAESALKVLMGATGFQIRKVDFSAEHTNAHILLEPKLIVR
ncbi:MAG: LacI family DNA-binding transcriptional regulator [Actinobacteria bacterium]|nr:LacI family DNA-binding transcriptional regulator [Actinomycetota bacterium]